MAKYATLLLLTAVVLMTGCRRNDTVPPRAEKHDATKDTPASTVSDFVDPALAADQAELAAEITRRKTVPAIGQQLPPSTTTAPAMTPQPATAPATDAAAATTQPAPLPDATPPPATAPAPATMEPAAPDGTTGGAAPAGAAPAPKTGDGEFDLPGGATPPAEQ